jgi:ABC-type branched-subunit amino acid transport system substrate-binding protein
MRRSRWPRHLAALTALALVAAACGDGDDAAVDDDTDVAAPEDDAPDDTDDDTDEDVPTDEELDVERPERDETLNLGYILPETGDLEYLGTPQIAGVELAVQDINEAGGVLGNDVSLSTGDEAGDASIARETAARLVNEGVDAIIGAAASGMSQEFIQLLEDNEIVQCSAANTSPAFTDQENNSYYIRTVGPDEGVTPIFVNEVVGDGYSNIAVLARADDYGQALLQLVVEGLQEQVEVVLDETYNPDSDDFSALVSQVQGSGADAVVVIGFGEAAPLYLELLEAGIGPEGLYGGDGVFSPDLPELVGTDIDGLKVIGAAGNEDFNQRLNEEALGEDDQNNFIYGGQAYDCVMIIALAAVAADSTDPVDFNEELEGITRDGEPCDSFEACVELLEAGEDIDYQGASGPIEMERPDPQVGRYAVGVYENGELTIIDDQDVNLADL